MSHDIRNLLRLESRLRSITSSLQIGINAIPNKKPSITNQLNQFKTEITSMHKHQETLETTNATIRQEITGLKEEVSSLKGALLKAHNIHHKQTSLSQKRMNLMKGTVFHPSIKPLTPAGSTRQIHTTPSSQNDSTPLDKLFHSKTFAPHILTYNEVQETIPIDLPHLDTQLWKNILKAFTPSSPGEGEDVDEDLPKAEEKEEKEEEGSSSSPCLRKAARVEKTPEVKKIVAKVSNHSAKGLRKWLDDEGRGPGHRKFVAKFWKDILPFIMQLVLMTPQLFEGVELNQIRPCLAPSPCHTPHP